MIERIRMQRGFLTWLLIYWLVGLTLVTGLHRFQKAINSKVDHQEGITDKPSIHESISTEAISSDSEGVTRAPGSTDSAPCYQCPGSGVCVPHVQCPAHVRMSDKPLVCHLPEGRHGICCTTGQNHTTHEELKARSSNLYDKKALHDAKEKSKLKLARLIEKEAEIMSNHKYRTVIARSDPTFGHFQSQRSINLERSSKRGMEALQNLFAMQALKERQSMSHEHISLGVDKIVLDDSPCPPPPQCHHLHKKYRSLDGSCNHLKMPTWGATRTPVERLLPPHYDDGIWSPRLSSTGAPLRSARAASSHLLPDRDRPHHKATLLVMQFGQFLAHDISSSVTLTFVNGSGISCCAEDGSFIPQELQHFGCYPIHVGGQDSFYGAYKQDCMNFVRTQLAPDHDCSLGYAKQMNGVTHYLDLSQVYGSDPETVGPLREWVGGRMKMFDDFGRDLLPLSDDKDDCITMEQGSACFKSGDGHANQMISLVAVHMVFTREHNRVAEILSHLNPHWSEQLVFLEARRIVIAELQHVVYKEWLPLVIGDKTMNQFELSPQPYGEYAYNYDDNVNPSLTNEFGVAAFRFGHSNVDGKLKIPKGPELEEVISIPELMFHPARLRIREFYDRLLNGLTSQPMQETDPSISQMLTQYLFRGGSPFGMDLASLNIQRGRDHGLRSYNDYRELVGLPRIYDFEEFGHKVAEHLKMVYATVDDIDLWIGGLLETPESDALVGYTFKEIIADQFSRLRKGDRYFYEHSPATNPGHFTKAQLQEIKKVSMARLICDNSDHIELLYQSPNAFIRPDVHGNEPIPCHDTALPIVNFSPWKEF